MNLLWTLGGAIAFVAGFAAGLVLLVVGAAVLFLAACHLTLTIILTYALELVGATARDVFDRIKP